MVGKNRLKCFIIAGFPPVVINLQQLGNGCGQLDNENKPMIIL